MAAGGRRRADHPALEALRHFRAAVANQGRLPLYQALLEATIDDVERGGITAGLLAQPGPDPIEDSVPLRLLAAVHRLVLEGRAQELAAFYPSAGGSFRVDDGADAGRAFLRTVAAHPDAVAEGLARPVQTNEVGRARALLVGFLEVATATGLPLRILEIGASAGLNLRWDRYRYEGGSGGTAFGPVDSPVRFGPGFRDEPPDLGRLAVVVERRGCDELPLDVASAADRTTVRSFVWPEQADRLERLEAAFDVACRVAAPVDRADAADWLDDQLADERAGRGTATVVFQSIVWQYFTGRTRTRVLASLNRAGRLATHTAPLAWLRMEPAGGLVSARSTEIRLSSWPGPNDVVLGRAGYHGQWVAAL